MYSCSDFTDDITEALGVNIAGMEDMPEEQFQACLEKIEAMKAKNSKLTEALRTIIRRVDQVESAWKDGDLAQAVRHLISDAADAKSIIRAKNSR